VDRLCFAREHENWENDQWANVLFTDESRFYVNSIDGRERLYHRRGEQDEHVNFTPTVSYGGGSVMIWGGICLGARTELVVVNGALNAHGYIHDLPDNLVPFAPHIGEKCLRMHDNVRPHKAHCAICCHIVCEKFGHFNRSENKLMQLRDNKFSCKIIDNFYALVQLPPIKYRNNNFFKDTHK